MTDPTCSRCKQTKPKTEFHKSKARRSGVESWCKSCRREYQRTQDYKASQANRRRDQYADHMMGYLGIGPGEY